MTLAVAEVEKTSVRSNPVSDMSNPFSSLQNFEAAQRMSRALSESTMIPEEYRKNIPNCLIALEISQRVRASVLMVMQNLYIVHGKPGWSAQYIISAINSCGKFSPLRFQFDDEKNPTSCQAYAIETRTGETLYGSTITMQMAREEGWATKNGSKWKTMPEQMLRYRAASFFGKVYAPEILMGFQTTEEIEDMQQFSNAKKVQSEVVAEVPKEKEAVKEAMAEVVVKEPIPDMTYEDKISGLMFRAKEQGYDKKAILAFIESEFGKFTGGVLSENELLILSDAIRDRKIPIKPVVKGVIVKSGINPNAVNPDDLPWASESNLPFVHQS